MTRVFNRKKDQEKRRGLRAHMTHAEVLLWMKLKNRQIHGERFLRQYGVDQFVLDFYCPRLKLAIEVDGESHYADGAEEHDEFRQQHIEMYGIHFLRFTNADVFGNLDGVLSAIYQCVESLSLNETHFAIVANPPESPLHRRGDGSEGG